MAVCLDYQAVYLRREQKRLSVRSQIVTGLCLLFVLALKVWVKIESIDLGYQLAREREISVSLDMERRELELQKSLLHRPDSLARMAREKLGLVALDPQQTERLRY